MITVVYYIICLCILFSLTLQVHAKYLFDVPTQKGSGIDTVYGSGNSGSGSGSSNGSHDEVDFSLCFEDTAILYGVCLVAWILAGFQFVCAPYHRKNLPFSLLHIAKIVSSLQ